LKYANARFWYQVQSCEDDGGIGTIIYNFDPEIFYGGLGSGETAIHSAAISNTDGEYLPRDKIGTLTALNTFDGKEICFVDLGRSEAIPCPSDWFCNFDFGDHGFCEYCGDIEEAQNCATGKIVVVYILSVHY